MNKFLDRLRAGEPTLMMSIRSMRTPDVMRIAHATGHHSIMVDLEHSAMSLDAAALLCGTANDLGMTPFVRSPERSHGVLGRLLDGGAAGIIAPCIDTVAEAEAIARTCRFPPRGQRSQLGMMPQYGFRPMPARTLNPLLDDATVVQILLETPGGIASADAIAALDGVDMLTIGMNDLCAELGCLGQFDDPRVRDAVKAAADACRAHGKLLMVGGVPDLSLSSRRSCARPKATRSRRSRCPGTVAAATSTCSSPASRMCRSRSTPSLTGRLRNTSSCSTSWASSAWCWSSRRSTATTTA